MTTRLKWTIVVAVSLLALGATAVVGVLAWQEFQNSSSSPSAVETASAVDVAGDRIVFRNTASGQGYGHVASVPLDDPTAARAVTDTACDRVDATDDEFVCLRTERGIAPTFTAALFDHDGVEQAQWPLPGIPSRTRLSADGSRIATTAFVTGHSYATVGFSTETIIRTAAGESLGNLEDFTLTIDGQPIAAIDRNFWGVTFVDDQTFYATASSGGKTWLVLGDLGARTLTSVAEGVECPSVSPDGTRIAFKRVTSGDGPTVHWTPAVLDLATGGVTLLPEERGIDDQIEWLDDETILYGLPREGVAGDTDVWALAADGSGEPEIFIEHAWSPSVVRG
ncbi:MAG TPA: hypothetical protein VNT50_02130 [Microbacterium sp.]|uniref:hypothetical protein n=1 Tax=Microbacterium sp. TaxID=51671 RepID=UPI002C4E3BB4|nr:hypothetical protein [Microbacterium sp.]HWI30264.1 hypothetical protein [Microbacterium sp.]